MGTFRCTALSAAGMLTLDALDDCGHRSVEGGGATGDGRREAEQYTAGGVANKDAKADRAKDQRGHDDEEETGGTAA